MNDRPLLIAFGISLGLHGALLVKPALPLRWVQAPAIRPPLRVVYEQPTVRSPAHPTRAALVRALRQAGVGPSTPGAGDGPRIRVPDRPTLGTMSLAPDWTPRAPSVVDLTDLLDAARGDAVLLSYFGAIRERIQRTANQRPWLTTETTPGVVYVSFQLDASGLVREARVVPERSAASSALQQVAVRIVTSAAPFPPFPPSLSVSTKTIIIPLEFVMGS